MKYLLILADGAADEPLAELGGKTPLEVAKKPNIDRIAREGRCGMLKTVDESMVPGSDVANMSILGYDPKTYYTGRGALEALSMGIPFGQDDVAYRCNLVTIENGKMKDFSAGHITSKEGAALLKSLQDIFPMLTFYPGVSYRNVIMFPRGKGVNSTAPHDIVGQVINSYLPQGEDANILMKAMVSASDVFENHPVNKKRISEGKIPATTIWPWSGGKRPKMPSFESKYHKKGAMISAVDLLFGIAICAGMKIVKVPGATGFLDTNYMGKAKAAVETLKGDVDFLYMHVEATDEAGHLGSIEEKIKAIENLDKAIGYILEHFDGCIMLMPDHPTPIAKKTHTHDAVPFAIMGKDKSDDCTIYSEKECREHGAYGVIQAVDLLDMVFKE
ncbi:MAG TPA: cofactor-independent phosphoglycerate mutase [Methanocorpusculum sp.]|nr:cofactor-independent phosphoglycerate mutase [Methanocorpusculum sp.]